MLYSEILALSRARELSPWFDRRLKDQIEQGLFLDEAQLQEVRDRLVRQLAEYRQQTGAGTAVLGMSGGVDSTLNGGAVQGGRVARRRLRQPFQTGVLVLEPLQALRLADIHPAILGLPLVDGRIARARLWLSVSGFPDQLWAAVGQVCDLFDPGECWNYFKAAGYETD